MATGTYGGSITLASVSDGSSGQTLYTWIRYADDGQGTNMSPAPLATTKYIGIANNKQSETPSEDYRDYVWSEYVGKDGDGTVYDIQSGHEKIYKFFSSISSGIVYSPEAIAFQAYKIEAGQSVLMNPNSEYDTDITMAGHTTEFGHIWSFLNRLTGQRQDEFSEQANLLSVARTIGADNVQFNFGELTYYSVTEELGNTPEDVELFNKFITLLNEENIYFIYKIFTYHSHSLEPASGDLLAMKAIPLEFGTSEDMARFALTANAIQMAVNNSKLTFDATNGLTIQNGGLRIVGMDGTTTLMEYSPTGNALKIVGNGEFTGTIHATEGSFAGDVSANTLIARSGDIGSFIIKENGLYSKEGAIQTEDGYNTDGSLIKLLGEDGCIDAENINLGIGAYINKYIQLGNARLWNPNDGEANGTLLEAGAVTLSQTGKLELGQITLNGPESKIYGSSFSITPDQATFNNINASGKISTVVFEQNHLQSVGGSMMFKPSYKIVGQTNDTLILDEEFSGKEGNYVYLVKEDGKVISGLIQIGKISGKTITVSTQLPGDKLISLIDLGTDGDLIIGINSGNSSEFSNNKTSYLKPRGLTISEFHVNGNGLLTEDEKDIIVTENKYIEENNLTEQQFNENKALYYTYNQVTKEYVQCTQSTVYNSGTIYYTKSKLLLASNGTINASQNPKVFLGDLDTSGINFMSGDTTHRGFGLYSENVYLTGSLTTQVANNSGSTFAGVNTLNGASATKFTNNSSTINDTSKIVFWAGSAGTDSGDIQKSPFQITERGSLYAAQGLFEGAIISKSRIEGADIYAARIHGWKQGTNGNASELNSLTFYDATKGIVFKAGDYDGTGTDTSTEIFTIGTDGLQTNGVYFIKIDKSHKVIFEGDAIHIPEYYTDTTQSYYLHLDKNQIFGSHIGDNDLEEIQANITFSEQKLSMGLGQNNENITLDVNSIKLKSEIVSMNNTVFFGERLKYEQVNNGYDLYVV